MKKNKRWLIIALGLLVAGFFLLKFLFKEYPCTPPERPNSLPNNAVWKGGCDGGHWIEFVDDKNDKIRFRIYRDWNGELILDADFEYENCNHFQLSQSNWIDYVAYFGNELVIYEKPNLPQDCWLKPIYPAYYEEDLN